MKNIKSTIFCILCLTISFSLGIYLIVKPSNSFSEEENRALQTHPELNIHTFFNGEFFSTLKDFCADQFPMRASLFKLSSISELSLGRIESSNVIVASEGYLIPRHDYKSNKILEDNITAINSFFKYTNENNISANIVLVPRSVDVVRKNLPKTFPKKYSNTLYSSIYSFLSASDEYIIDTLPELKSAAESNAYVWYKTDHHWTTHGAYIAYEQISRKLDFKAFSKDDFNIICASNDFLGTTHSKIFIPVTDRDKIYLYRYEDDQSISVYLPTSDNYSKGFYDFSKLDEKDKYQIFLGGNTDIVHIRKSGEKRKRLLIIKDSFANSLVPFLARHFDIDAIDLRYFKKSVISYIDQNKIDGIMLIYGVDTLATDASTVLLTK